MISAKNLNKKYGSFHAIKDVSFEVDKGEIVGFLGSNAAGKTTTMRILTCYFPPTSGSAKVAGYDVVTQSLDVRKNVGYLPENVPLYKDMSVEYFLEFVGSLKGISSKKLDSKIDEVIERCDLEDVREFDIGTLSKGYRQRVGIAQAIISDPKVLILDEPTVGLDPKQIVDIRNLIRSFGGKSTVILSTHILHEIEKVCDRILIINRGEILAFDTIANLQRRLAKDVTINLTVEGSAEKVKNTLKDSFNVTKLKDLGKLEKGVYQYSFRVSRDSDNRRGMAAALIEKGYNVIELKEMKMSAEDIFRKLVPDSDRKVKTKDEDSDVPKDETAPEEAEKDNGEEETKE